MRTDYEAIAVVGAPIGHVVALRASYFVAREIGRREKLDFGDDNCFVASSDRVWRGVFNLVRGYEEGVGWGVKDASFMEIGSARVMYQELKSGIGPEKGKEGVVIDEKGFWLWSGWRYKSGSGRRSVAEGTRGA